MIMTSRLKLKKHSFADSVTKVCFAIFYKIKKVTKIKQKCSFFCIKTKNNYLCINNLHNSDLACL